MCAYPTFNRVQQMVRECGAWVAIVRIPSFGSVRLMTKVPESCPTLPDSVLWLIIRNRASRRLDIRGDKDIAWQRSGRVVEL